MTSSMFRGFGDTGPARGAHGFAASAQVANSSAFGPRQTLTQEQYAALAKQLDGVVATMKSVGAHWRVLGGLSDSYDTSTALGQINATLRKARGAVNKAEAHDEDGENEDTQAAIDSAQKLLTRAKKMIAAAIEDVESEEDDSAVEAAKSAHKKVAARLAALKAKPAPAAAAPAAVITENVAKAAAALNRQTGVLQSQLNGIIEMLSHTSRSAGMPPVPRITKAANDSGIPSNSDIEGAIEAGLLDRTHGGDARMIRNIAMQGDLVAARTRRDRSKNTGIHGLFRSL